MNRNEVWAQGSEPGDPPISSVVVPVDPAFTAREEARDRIRVFARGPRPNAGSPAQRIHDLALALGLDD